MSQPASGVATTSAPQLKYLGFVRAASLQIYALLIHIYEHLKDKAGPLKSGIESVEGTVKTVVGPVLDRVDLQPDEYLKFLDEKVDGTVKYAEGRAPDSIKNQISSAYGFISTIPDKAQVAADTYKQKGAVSTAQEYLHYFYPILFAYIEQVYKVALTVPLVPQLAGLIQPLAVAVARQYNSVLAQIKKSDNTIVKNVAGLLPDIPVQKAKKQE